MRVAIIGPVGHDLFASNVARGLRRLGHEAVLVGPARWAPSWKAFARGSSILSQSARGGRSLERATMRRCLAAEPDLVLSLQVDVSPPTIENFARQGIPSCLWFPDALTNIGRLYPWIAPYSAVFFKEPLLAERAREYAGIAAYYLPEACDPEIHAPPIGVEPGMNPHVVVVGNMYASRVRLLRRLRSDGVPLQVFGSPWARWLQADDLHDAYAGKAVFGREKAQVFRGAAAVLNNLHPGEIDGMNCRLFEAAASGACVVTERRPALQDLFSDDQHVRGFSSYAELLVHLRHAVGEPSKGRVLGDRASVHAHTHHTYEERLKDLLGQAL